MRAGQESAKKAIGFIEVCFWFIFLFSAVFGSTFCIFFFGIDNYMFVEFKLIKVGEFENKLQAIVLIGKDEGIKGYWKGNLPQVRSIFTSNRYFRIDFNYVISMIY